MSSGIGIQELVLLFVIGLLILGPERLPRVASQIGRWVGRARRTANQLRYQLEREIALADIEKSAKTSKTTKTKPASADASPAAQKDPAQADAASVADSPGGETIARPEAQADAKPTEADTKAADDSADRA